MADKPEQAPSSTAPPGETGAEQPRKLADFASSRKDVPPRPTPRRTGGKSAPAAPAAPRVNSLAPGVIAKGMAEVYATAGMFLMALDPEIGTSLAQNSDNIGRAWETLAAESDAVRAVAEKMLTGGAWSGFIVAHVPIGMAVKSSVDTRRAAAKVRREQAEAEAASGLQVPGPNVKRAS